MIKKHQFLDSIVDFYNKITCLQFIMSMAAGTC